MFRKLGRYRALIGALAVAGGLSVASATLDLGIQLVIIAPTQVIGGNPINGYVIGMEDPCTINAWINTAGPIGPIQQFLGCGMQGFNNPLWFSYPTFEYMAPSMVFLAASDSDETAMRGVWIK